MKKILVSFLVFIPSLACFSGAIVLEGKYMNKNLYVQNGTTGTGVGFCISEVRVNGNLTNDEINSSAFEVDLAQHQLRYGQDLTIEIRYKDDGCAPKILNPDAVRPKATYQQNNIYITEEGVLVWSTTDENGPLPYVIEQYRWNKWIKVGEVSGIGTSEQHQYSFRATLHSGENRFRVKQIGYNKQARISSEVKITSSLPKLEYTTDRKWANVTFTGETMYEMYDLYGTLVKKGYGSKIDVTNLQKGGYYLCYDNAVAEIKKPH